MWPDLTNLNWYSTEGWTSIISILPVTDEEREKKLKAKQNASSILKNDFACMIIFLYDSLALCIHSDKTLSVISCGLTHKDNYSMCQLSPHSMYWVWWKLWFVNVYQYLYFFLNYWHWTMKMFLTYICIQNAIDRLVRWFLKQYSNLKQVLYMEKILPVVTALTSSCTWPSTLHVAVVNNYQYHTRW